MTGAGPEFVGFAENTYLRDKYKNRYNNQYEITTNMEVEVKTKYKKNAVSNSGNQWKPPEQSLGGGRVAGERPSCLSFCPVFSHTFLALSLAQIHFLRREGRGGEKSETTNENVGG